MSTIEFLVGQIEREQFNSYAGFLENFTPWQQFKAHAEHTDRERQKYFDMLVQNAERSMNPPCMLISENPFRDYRELFLKANAARRMYRFVTYVLGFICIALVALALCMVATNVLVGGLVW